MEPTEKKQRFIELRAKGCSYPTIEKKLHISRGTCSAWEKELAGEVSRMKREEMEGLYRQYGMVREARIKRLGESLESIQTALKEADWREVPAEKLLDAQLKYAAALRREYIPVAEEVMIGNDTSAVLRALEELLRRVRAGDVDGEQAKTELATLQTMIKTIETTELQSRLETLEGILKSRGE